MAMHCVVVGHATASSSFPGGPKLLSTILGVGVPGEVGSNVNSRPKSSTAVHWLLEGHATPFKRPPGSTTIGVGWPGEDGLNVTSWPSASTAVHWLLDGHATDCRFPSPLRSIGAGEDHTSDARAAAGRPSKADTKTRIPATRTNTLTRQIAPFAVAHMMGPWDSCTLLRSGSGGKRSESGASRTRTGDLLGAIQALSQLSYSPE